MYQCNKRELENVMQSRDDHKLELAITKKENEILKHQLAETSEKLDECQRSLTRSSKIASKLHEIKDMLYTNSSTVSSIIQNFSK